jgi:putative inorganic carbon (hco3(-)) transporter
VRDILITLIIGWLILQIIKKPYLGVLVWTWLSLMNPHRLTYGFAYSMPFNMIIAALTIVMFFVGKENKKLPINGISILLILFVVWQTITTFASPNPEGSWVELVRVYKIQLVILLTLIMIQTKERIILLVTVIAISIGFFGIKGGVFAIGTGLSFRIWGPPGTFIEGNNELGLALLVVVPLFHFMRGYYQNIWVKRFLLVSMVLIAASIISTYSRGAFLAGIAMTFFLWWKTKNKLATGLSVLLFSAVVYVALPSAWFERMDTVETYDEDASAMGRLTAWELGIDVANNSVTGGGFAGAYTVQNYIKYIGIVSGIDAHSIYFEVLGEQGYIGLIIFLSMYFLGWRQGKWIIKATKNVAELEWANRLAIALQVSLVAYATGGAFLGLAYYDLPYYILALLVVTRIAVERDLEAMKQQEIQDKLDLHTKAQNS